MFIIGAQRSGSTYLYHLLNSHPCILMNKPINPEPKFFLEKYKFQRGKNFYEEKYFPDRNLENIKYIGEKSTSYIESKDAAIRIKNFYPDARILVILRDPVNRALSNYKFSVENGLENLSFSDALSKEDIRIKKLETPTSVSPYAYKARGMYINYIREYEAQFSRDKIYVLIFEELLTGNVEEEKLAIWLDLEPKFIAPIGSDKINSSKSEYPVDRQLLKELIGEYQDSINDLESFLGRRITIWRNNHINILCS